MALFGKKDRDALLDVIRCDEDEYLIWKWRPRGAANSTSRENAIRWGSSLRVKEGEVAVFVYMQHDGQTCDYIAGPFDETLKTSNFPVLASVIGAAYGGGSPFQAEVYFINLQGNIRQEFGVPYFDVADADPRLDNFPVPVAASGSFVFRLQDFRHFVKLHRLVDFDLGKFRLLVRDAVTRTVKAAVASAPMDHGLRVLQIERKLGELNELIEPQIRAAFGGDFGVELVRFDLSRLQIDKESPQFAELRRISADLQGAMMVRQNDVAMANLEQTQAINAEHMAASLAIQREQTAVFQQLQSQSQFLAAHQINRQADVLTSAADSLGAMGSMGAASGPGGGGFNPVGLMTGMAVGGAMGSQMAGMLNTTGQAMQQAQNAPPPLPILQFHVSIDGQARGPFDLGALQAMARSGQMNASSLAWRAGLDAWTPAGQLPELAALFAGAVPPPLPPSATAMA